MKKFMFVSMIVFVLFMVACASQQSAGSNGASVASTGKGVERQAVETSDDVAEIPCFTSDDDKFFRCSGYNTNEVGSMDSMSVAALENAQTQCVMKAARSVQGIMRTYYDRYAKSKKGNDLSNKMQQALDQVIKTDLGITKEICRKRSKYEDGDGNITLYIGIEINKEALGKAYAKKVEDNLTQDEKTNIDFKEDQFRKETAGAFENYKSSAEQDKQDYEKANNSNNE